MLGYHMFRHIHRWMLRDNAFHGVMFYAQHVVSCRFSRNQCWVTPWMPWSCHFQLQLEIIAVPLDRDDAIWLKLRNSAASRWADCHCFMLIYAPHFVSPDVIQRKLRLSLQIHWFFQSVENDRGTSGYHINILRFQGGLISGVSHMPRQGRKRHLARNRQIKPQHCCKPSTWRGQNTYTRPGKLTWLWKITIFNGKTHYK